MIVQNAPEGQPRFVILQTDHALASGQLARAFGNDEFTALHPQRWMEFVVSHHDEGWSRVDANAELDPNTRLPFHLTQTPTRLLLQTGKGAPDFNENHHPFCGLIASMHTYGLYHGRYGLSDMIFIDRVAPDLKPQVEAMLQNELDRQARLKTQLSDDWQSEAFVFHNYKLLQFFDTLALYVQTQHASQLKEAQFKNVPRRIGDDVTITAKPIGENTIALSPYPFNRDEVTINTRGRCLIPLSEEDVLDEVMNKTPFVDQSFKFTMLK
jgi:hypothetical protein